MPIFGESPSTQRRSKTPLAHGVFSRNGTSERRSASLRADLPRVRKGSRVPFSPAEERSSEARRITPNRRLNERPVLGVLLSPENGEDGRILADSGRSGSMQES